MKQARIYVSDKQAGVLTEDESGYTFRYDEAYLQDEAARPISLTMPLRNKTYNNSVLFPFFDGLIPEGWLLGIAGQNWKIDLRDRMSLLLACCKDCIGDVSVIKIEADE